MRSAPPRGWPATDVGARGVLDPAPVQPFDAELLALVDVVKPNEHEAERLTGLPAHEPEAAFAAAERLIARGARSAVITLGARGAIWVAPEGRGHVPAPVVTGKLGAQTKSPLLAKRASLVRACSRGAFALFRSARPFA